MPSVIHIDRRGNRAVGVRAYDQAMLAPENVAQGFKRADGHRDATAISPHPARR